MILDFLKLLAFNIILIFIIGTIFGTFTSKLSDKTKEFSSIILGIVTSIFFGLLVSKFVEIFAQKHQIDLMIPAVFGFLILMIPPVLNFVLTKKEDFLKANKILVGLPILLLILTYLIGLNTNYNDIGFITKIMNWLI